MNRLLEENRDVVIAAGKELAEIGALFAAGKIDEALARVEAQSVAYPEWAELDDAANNLDGATRDRERMLAVQNVLVDVVSAILGAALRGAIAL